MQTDFLSPEIKKNIWKVVLEYKTKREKVLADLDFDENKFKDEVREIKERTFRDIKNLRQKTITNLEKNGMKVFEAKDAKDAERIIKDLTATSKLIVKAKTTAADEIGIDEILKDKELVSTDLGDFIMSIAGEQDMHPASPAYHLTPEEISEIIKNKLGETVTPTAKDIAIFVRGYLRGKFKEADTGISGANVITSDGRIVLLENEGNISLVSRLPDKHIIIAGWEKIVPTIEDAMKIVRATTVWALGVDWPVYVSIISGPSKTADIQKQLIIGAQGAKEVYLVLLDNGRDKILEEGLEELLYCINCGACLNLCPAYHQLGTKYGDKYLGSKGIIMSAFMVNLLRAKDSGCYSCTLCGACRENCPVKIDLPELMKKVREKLNKENLETEENKKMIANIRKFGNSFGEMKEGKTPKELFCC